MYIQLKSYFILFFKAKNKLFLVVSDALTFLVTEYASFCKYSTEFNRSLSLIGYLIPRDIELLQIFAYMLFFRTI